MEKGIHKRTMRLSCKNKRQTFLLEEKSQVVTMKLLQCKRYRKNELKFCPGLERLILFVTLGDHKSLFCHQTRSQMTDTFCSDQLPSKIIVFSGNNSYERTACILRFSLQQQKASVPRKIQNQQQSLKSTVTCNF